jgi:hypothetical protein
VAGILIARSDSVVQPNVHASGTTATTESFAVSGPCNFDHVEMEISNHSKYKLV